MGALRENLTDRALRYRAQKNVTGPKRCVLCGSTKDLGVMHLDGNESNGERANLAYGCRSCNGTLGHAFKTVGAGRLTHQYNPSAGVPTFQQYMWAVSNHERKAHDQGGAIIHATPKSKRIEYARRIASKAQATKKERASDRWNPAGGYLVVDPEMPYKTYRAASLEAARTKALKLARKAYTHVSIKTVPQGDDPFGKHVEIVSPNPGARRSNLWPFGKTLGGKGMKGVKEAAKDYYVEGVGSFPAMPAALKAAHAEADTTGRIVHVEWKTGLSKHSQAVPPRRAAVKRLERETEPRKVSRYRGHSISATPDGEYFSSLDPSSWYETQREVRASIDTYLKNRNPPRNPSWKPTPESMMTDLSKQGFMKRGKLKAKIIYRAMTPHGATYTGPDRHTAEQHVRQYGGKVQREMNPGSVKYTEDLDRLPSKGLDIYDNFDMMALGKGAAEITIVPVHGDRLFKWRKVGQDGSQDYFKTAEEALHFIQHHYYGKPIKIRNPASCNPADGAVSAYEEFHGRQPDEVVTIKKKVHFHEHLAGAGQLRALKVRPIDKGPVRTLEGFGKKCLLAFNEAKNQLFVEGGDQALSEKELRAFGIDQIHELETLGKVVGVDYFTTKDHLGDEGGTATYEHGFRMTNENGQHVVVKIARYPDLIYRVRDEQLEFSGGSYEIRAEGIDK